MTVTLRPLSIRIAMPAKLVGMFTIGIADQLHAGEIDGDVGAANGEGGTVAGGSDVVTGSDSYGMGDQHAGNEGDGRRLRLREEQRRHGEEHSLS